MQLKTIEASNRADMQDDLNEWLEVNDRRPMRDIAKVHVESIQFSVAVYPNGTTGHIAYILYTK